MSNISGIVRYSGYKGESSRGRGMRNKRKAKNAKLHREIEMVKLRHRRDTELRQESWLEEWGHLSGDSLEY